MEGRSKDNVGKEQSEEDIEEVDKRRKGGKRIVEDSGSNSSSTELATKCRKYSKLIHKLREKLALTQVMAQRIIID